MKMNQEGGGGAHLSQNYATQQEFPEKKGEVRRLVQITLLFPLSFSPGDTT